MHVISQIVDGGATEADGGASAPVGPSVATHWQLDTTCSLISAPQWNHMDRYEFIGSEMLPVKADLAISSPVFAKPLSR